jgi:pimeloyl-ACP methyl ester carboxylesterase
LTPLWDAAKPLLYSSRQTGKESGFAAWESSVKPEHSQRMRCFMRLLRIVACLLLSAGFVRADEAGYRKEVTVSGPTRLDWTFALANQSTIDPPEEWLQGYNSTQQRYELFVPPKVKDRKHGHPVVLFISAGDAPAGWSQLEAVCRQQGILFASPYDSGNNTPMPRRVRIVLDVLDDIRRLHPVDPDRTYVAGFSGGGRVACAMAFALPELFGGVMPICAGGELREEPWLRHRAIERLSMGFVTGTNDFNLGEVSRFCGPMFGDIGIQTKVTVVPNLGHGIPDGKALAPVLDWLDKGVADRRKLAEKYPASRIDGDRAPSREEWAKELLAEGKSRIKDRTTVYSGLMQLQGVMTRWPDLATADEARQILLDYENRNDKPWEADDIAEQRKFLIARARAVDGYGSGDLPEQYLKQRPDMLNAAIALWEQVLADGQDAKAVAEAKRRIPVLTKMLASE